MPGKLSQEVGGIVYSHFPEDGRGTIPRQETDEDLIYFLHLLDDQGRIFIGEKFKKLLLLLVVQLFNQVCQITGMNAPLILASIFCNVC